MHLYLCGAATRLGVVSHLKMICTASMLSHWMAGCISADVRLLQGHQLLQQCAVMPAVDTDVLIALIEPGHQMC